MDSYDKETKELMDGITGITNAYNAQVARIPKLEKKIAVWKGVSLSIGVAALTYVIVKEVVR